MCAVRLGFQNPERSRRNVPQQVEGSVQRCRIPLTILSALKLRASITWLRSAGNNAAEPFWYYVLQRKDSPEILDLAKYESFEQAIEGAKSAVAAMHRAAAAK